MDNPEIVYKNIKTGEVFPCFSAPKIGIDLDNPVNVDLKKDYRPFTTNNIFIGYQLKPKIESV